MGAPAPVVDLVERFLGSVIRLTEGHQAKVEQKPEVRKAGGVYYAPFYIVDHIVKNTVGKLHSGRTPTHLTTLPPLLPSSRWTRADSMRLRADSPAS